MRYIWHKGTSSVLHIYVRIKYNFNKVLNSSVTILLTQATFIIKKSANNSVQVAHIECDFIKSLTLNCNL